MFDTPQSALPNDQPIQSLLSEKTSFLKTANGLPVPSFSLSTRDLSPRSSTSRKKFLVPSFVELLNLFLSRPGFDGVSVGDDCVSSFLGRAVFSPPAEETGFFGSFSSYDLSCGAYRRI